MALLLDVSRLLENRHLQTPTGLERVELAYAQHFLHHADGRDLRFVVTWPTFTGVLDSHSARTLIKDVAARWQFHKVSGFHELQAALNETPDKRRRAPLQIGAPDRSKGFHDHAYTVASYCKSGLRPLSARTIAQICRDDSWYIQVAQFRLDRPKRFRWMANTKVRGLFMLHDLIPIMHPEFCRPGEAKRHTDRVETMLDRAALIVTNSEFTRQALSDYAAGRTLPRAEVVPLGISTAFAMPRSSPALQATIPYFVVIGTIEPRKNLEFLLTLWRRWTNEGQSPRARLVVVGRRGWEIETVSKLLDQSSGLAPTVIEARSLSDADMIALLRGAAALLAPSSVEGFGLPIAEALALGVPVVASDIAAHREVGGTFADYVSPIDGPGWQKALEDYAAPGSPRRQQRLDALRGYRATTWADHMARVEQLMAEAGRS